ncbi:MAG TPA: biotin/lipoyl-containing protein, partial [Actinomycetota bacterium]|nr:biotin/lipoyl-containing protein [Actinomycetota bacterium]
RGSVTTTWLSLVERNLPSDASETPDQVLSLAAAAWVDQTTDRSDTDPWASLGAWRLGGEAPMDVVIRVEGAGEATVAIFGGGPYLSQGHAIARDERCHGWSIDGAPASAVIEGAKSFVWFGGGPFEVALGYEERSAEAVAGGHLGAPMPGQILSVRVAAGDRVTKGQALVVMEAMKMEHTIRAPIDGVVAAVLCSEGEQVKRGKTLVDFETER